MVGLVVYGGVFIALCAVGGLGYFHFGNPQSTCASCHEMTGVHSGWQTSAHRTIHCRDCHGGSLTLDFHALQSHVDRLVRHFTGDPNQPVKLQEKHVAALQESCRACHPQASAGWISGGCRVPIPRNETRLRPHLPRSGAQRQGAAGERLFPLSRHVFSG